MSDPLFAIINAAADLKVAAPEQYERLVEAFRDYERRAISDLLAAGTDVIVGAQSKAWLLSQLRQKLEDCLNQRANYEKRK